MYCTHVTHVASSYILYVLSVWMCFALCLGLTKVVQSFLEPPVCPGLEPVILPSGWQNTARLEHRHDHRFCCYSHFLLHSRLSPPKTCFGDRTMASPFNWSTLNPKIDFSNRRRWNPLSRMFRQLLMFSQPFPHGFPLEFWASGPLKLSVCRQTWSNHVRPNE